MGRGQHLGNFLKDIGSASESVFECLGVLGGDVEVVDGFRKCVVEFDDGVFERGFLLFGFFELRGEFLESRFHLRAFGFECFEVILSFVEGFFAVLLKEFVALEDDLELRFEFGVVVGDGLEVIFEFGVFFLKGFVVLFEAFDGF